MIIKSRFIRILKRLWDSPTFTTWGSQSAQSLRLFAVTPLILRNFDTPEIAAWYLFGSLMFFGDMVNTRMGAIFARMITFSMGGATDLAPVKRGTRIEKDVEPNWTLVERAYGSIGALNACLAVVNLMVAVGVGYYGLSAISERSDQPQNIWIAFFIVLFSKTITNYFQQYELALKGLNEIALANRWSIISTCSSVFAGFLALVMGANIWILALVMQLCTLGGIFANRIILFRLEDRAFSKFKSRCVDLEVCRWAFGPFVKGMAISMAENGTAQLASVVFARHGSVEITAAFLFTMRLLGIIQQISMTPFNSHQPLMSKMLIKNQYIELTSTIQRKLMESQLLFVIGVMLLSLFGDLALQLINANSGLLDKNNILLIGLLILIKQYQTSTLTVPALGNQIVFFWRSLFSAGIAAALCFVIIPKTGFYGVIFVTYIPQILALNIRSTVIASNYLSCKPGDYFWKSSGGPIFVQLLLIGLFIIYS